MTPLNDFKVLRASVPVDVQPDLYSLFPFNPDAAHLRMLELQEGLVGRFGGECFDEVSKRK